MPYLLWSNISSNQFQYADIGVIAAFGKMLPTPLLEVFKRGVINVHPSLLPRWRGSSPIIHSVLHADSKVGVTILQTSANRFDQGDILLQQSIDIDPLQHDRRSLSQLLTTISVPLLLRVLAHIDWFQQCAAVPQLPQNLSHHKSVPAVTVARKISAQQTEIDWCKQTSRDIDRIYRAAADLFPLQSRFDAPPLVSVRLFGFVPIERVDPAVTAHLNGEDDGHLSSIGATVLPGSARFLKWRPQYFYVHCADSWVGFAAILIGRQKHLRKRLTAHQFYTGYLCRLPPGAVLFY